MRYIIAFLWSFLLSSMVVYVVGNMSGTPFSITNAIVLAVVFGLAVIILSAGLKDDDEVVTE